MSKRIWQLTFGQTSHRTPKFRSVCWGLALLVSSSLTWAQAGADCKPNGLPEQVLACAVREAQHTDTALHLHYGEQMQGLSASERTPFRKAHAAWQRERDRMCRQAAAQLEGHAWALQQQHCLAQANRARLHGLKAASSSVSTSPTPTSVAGPSNTQQP